MILDQRSSKQMKPFNNTRLKNNIPSPIDENQYTNKIAPYGAIIIFD